MNPSTESVSAPASASSPLRGHVLKGCLAVAILALVPHLGKSTDITDGLRIGPDYSTNTAAAYAVMLGGSNTNPAYYSMALGYSNNLGGTSAGWGNIAAGYGNTVSGYTSFAFGYGNTASANNSMAVGYYNTSGGGTSLTFGSSNQAMGNASAAGGQSTIAGGSCATSLGYYTLAPSYASAAFGRYNSAPSGQSATNWVNTDQLFVIGNGTGPGVNDRKNALEVKKDGTVIIPKRQGDISMGSFTAP